MQITVRYVDWKITNDSVPIRVEILQLLNERLKNYAVVGIRTQDVRIKLEHRKRSNDQST